VVSIETAKAAYDSLTAMGYQITWRDYVMAHSVCVEEIQHISEFINNLFKPFP
jgi:phospholipase/carboxylesterase